MLSFKVGLIGLILLNSLATVEDWVRIQTKQEISFLFPTQGKQTRKDAGELKAWIYETQNTDCLFGVVCTPSPLRQGFFSSVDVQRIYNEMRDASVDMPDTELVEEKLIPVQGMSIRQICYTVISKEVKFTYYKRFVFRGNYIYQLTIGGKSETADKWKSQREKFFDSVQFPRNEQ